MEALGKYSGQVQLTDKDISFLVSTNIIPKNTPKEMIAIFGKVCAEKNLSPFSKQIYLIPRKISNEIKYTFQTSVDGYRSIAERTGVYAGNDDYKFNDEKSEYNLIEAKITKPTTATATVYKIVGGLRCPFSATARWEEYYPGDTQGFMWKKMPFLMLGKCAEALALRKAFPEALGGIYTNEEMQQAEIIEVKTDPKPETKTINQQGTEMFEPQKEELSPEILDKINKAKTQTELKNIWFELSDNDRPKYQEVLSTRKSILKANNSK